MTGRMEQDFSSDLENEVGVEGIICGSDDESMTISLNEECEDSVNLNSEYEKEERRYREIDKQNFMTNTTTVVVPLEEDHLEPLNSLRGMTKISDTLQRALNDLKRDEQFAEDTIPISSDNLDVNALWESRARLRKHVKDLASLIEVQERQQAKTQQEHFQMEEILRKTVADQNSKLEHEIHKAREDEKQKSRVELNEVEFKQKEVLNEAESLKREVDRVHNENTNANKQCKFLRSHLVNAGIQIESAMSAMREQRERSRKKTNIVENDAMSIAPRSEIEISPATVPSTTASPQVLQSSYQLSPARSSQVVQLHEALKIVTDVVAAAVKLPSPFSSVAQSSAMQMDSSDTEMLFKNLKKAAELIESSKDLDDFSQLPPPRIAGSNSPLAPKTRIAYRGETTFNLPVAGSRVKETENFPKTYLQGNQKNQISSSTHKPAFLTNPVFEERHSPACYSVKRESSEQAHSKPQVSAAVGPLGMERQVSDFNLQRHRRVVSATAASPMRTTLTSQISTTANPVGFSKFASGSHNRQLIGPADRTVFHNNIISKPTPPAGLVLNRVPTYIHQGSPAVHQGSPAVPSSPCYAVPKSMIPNSPKVSYPIRPRVDMRLPAGSRNGPSPVIGTPNRGIRVYRSNTHSQSPALRNMNPANSTPTNVLSPLTRPFPEGQHIGFSSVSKSFAVLNKYHHPSGVR